MGATQEGAASEESRAETAARIRAYVASRRIASPWAALHTEGEVSQPGAQVGASPSMHLANTALGQTRRDPAPGPNGPVPLGEQAPGPMGPVPLGGPPANTSGAAWRDERGGQPVGGWPSVGSSEPSAIGALELAGGKHAPGPKGPDPQRGPPG